MRIERFQPGPPPPTFAMTFTKDEGWAIVAALHEWVDRHREAVDRDEWRRWAENLDRELRR